MKEAEVSEHDYTQFKEDDKEHFYPNELPDNQEIEQENIKMHMDKLN